MAKEVEALSSGKMIKVLLAFYPAPSRSAPSPRHLEDRP